MKKANRIVSILLLALTAFLYYKTLPWADGAALMPRLLLILVGLLSTILLITGGMANVQKVYGSKPLFEGVEFPRLTFTIAASVLYIVAIKYLGFYSSTYLFLVGMFIFIRYTEKFKFLMVPACIVAFFYGIFSLWLKVPVSKGILF